MKRTYLVLIAAAVLGGGLMTGCQGNMSGQQTKVSENSKTTKKNGKTEVQKAKITEEQAKKAALEHANVTENDVTAIRVKADREDGKPVYEVDFYVENTEYDYEISGEDGSVLQSDYDIEDDFRTSADTSGTEESGNLITEAEAKKTALAKVQGATDEDIRLHLEKEDGRAVYEGDIFYNQMEYEFEIDAVSGKILEWSEEKH